MYGANIGSYAVGVNILELTTSEEVVSGQTYQGIVRVELVDVDN